MLGFDAIGGRSIAGRPSRHSQQANGGRAETVPIVGWHIVKGFYQYLSTAPVTAGAVSFSATFSTSPSFAPARQVVLMD